MARLSRRVDHGIRAHRSEAFEDGAPVPNIDLVMPERGMGLLQTNLVPRSVSGRAEEIFPHVGVDSVNPPPSLTEVSDGF